VDGWQQRHRVPAFIFAVFKKCCDGQAGNLVALLTYFAFLATFPLLLALSGILGLVLQGNPSLRASIQTSALSEFPIIGTQLQSQVGVASLGHSTPALIIGIVGATWAGKDWPTRYRTRSTQCGTFLTWPGPASPPTTCGLSACSACSASPPSPPRSPRPWPGRGTCPD